MNDSLISPIDETHAECLAVRETIRASFRTARERAARWQPAAYPGKPNRAGTVAKFDHDQDRTAAAQAI